MQNNHKRDLDQNQKADYSHEPGWSSRDAHSSSSSSISLQCKEKLMGDELEEEEGVRVCAGGMQIRRCRADSGATNRDVSNTDTDTATQ